MSDSYDGQRVKRQRKSDAEHRKQIEVQRQLAEKMFGRQDVGPVSVSAGPFIEDGNTSDSFTDGRVLRRSNSDTEYEHELELDRQRAEKELERQLVSNRAAQSRPSRRYPSGVESALRVLGILSVIGGLLGGWWSAESIEITSILVTSGVVSAISLFWMAEVLGRLHEIRDLLDRQVGNLANDLCESSGKG